MASQGALFGMGNPLLDIVATVPKSLMEKYGFKPNNAILAEEKDMPVYKELVDSYDVQYVAGGATQNAIRVAQWMLQTPAQATTFVGCVGKDAFGKTLEEAAEADNVKVHYMKVDDTPTGTCAVLVEDNERSLVANISAAGKYDIAHLKQDDTQALIKQASIFYISGFFLTVSPPSAMAVAEHSLAEGKVFSMNLSAPFICQFFTEPLMSLMPYIDLLFGNESEAAAFAEAHKWEEKSIPDIAKKIAQLPRVDGSKTERTVVITQGADCTVVATPSTVVTFDVTKIAKEDLVDSNGAGDAFVGGYLSQIVKGQSVEKAVQAGHYAAGVVIRESGCVFPKTAPTFE